MCGIAGFLDPSGRIREAREALGRMATAMCHRGPDDEGIHFDERSGLGFAFRRLAIQDRSQAGHQPMASASGRYQLVFNGEIYNFKTLRAELLRGESDIRFRGGSDTEVVLALFDRLGIDEALRRLVGMFAIAVWDNEREELRLVRDRLGVKPLYVGLTGEGAFSWGATPTPLGARALAFASELKALRSIEAMQFGLDRAALALFVRHAYVPGPWTIHPSVRKLPPGHQLRVREGQMTLQCWWSAKSAYTMATPFAGTITDAADRVGELLETSVGERMIADVPVGAFLSGGIDSSAVVATMAKVAPGRVRAFTIAMDDEKHDESERAVAVARHLNVDHTILRFTFDEALRLVPSLADIWDEPFADSSQLATLLVAKLARQHVTVALSGDGGDEVFGGYERYRRLPELSEWIQRVPAGLRAPLATGLSAGLTALGPVLDRWMSDRVHKLPPLLREQSPWAMFHRLTSVTPQPGDYLVDGHEALSPLTDQDWLLDGAPLVRAMMHADLISYLPDDILVKVDRATMAVSLEAREPLLDHRLIELAMGLPADHLVSHGRSKPVLRTLVERSLPTKLTDGPKRGFAVPLRRWLTGPLRSWADGLLDPTRLSRQGLFRPEPVRGLWEAALRGEAVEHQVWTILMFQAWADRWGVA
jgi:asparagine synthase (glutamine-hydrolysing)